MPSKFSLLARSRLPALVVAMLIGAVRPYRSLFFNSASGSGITSSVLIRSAQTLSASKAGQFELSDYVRSTFLRNVKEKTTKTPFKTVEPSFISLSTALEEYSGDNHGRLKQIIRTIMRL